MSHVGGPGRRSRVNRLSILVLLVPLLAPIGVGAEEAPVTPATVVEAFHLALASGERQAALDALSEGVTVFEAGAAEMSRAEYEAQHLGADMEFSGSTQREIVEQRTGSAGAYAWVLTRSATKGSFRGREVDSQGVETMLLRLTSEGWRITHIHWSSR